MALKPTQTEKLLQGNYTFSHSGFSMMLTRLKTMYAASPSDEMIVRTTAELNTFIEKFKCIMKRDYDALQLLLREENVC